MELFTKLFELFSKNYKVVFVTMIITMAIFFASLKSMFGVTLKDLTAFVVHQQKSIDKVANELKGINDMIDKAELVSHRNQQELLKIIQNQNNEPVFSRLLNLSNENQDIIRAQLEFGRIYAILVKSREGSEKNYGHLSEMYQALVLVTLDDPLDVNTTFNIMRQKAKENGTSVCGYDEAKKSSICEAKNKLYGIRNNLNDFPEIVRDNIKIEVLRYLSYCCARALETNKQIEYTEMAEDVLNDTPRMSKDNPRLYRRQYYWIDYSSLIGLVREGKPGFEEEAKLYFDKLRTGFVDNEGECNFLKHKLMQHQNLIPEERKSFWQDLIRKAGVS